MQIQSPTSTARLYKWTHPTFAVNQTLETSAKFNATMGFVGVLILRLESQPLISLSLKMMRASAVT